MLLKKKKKKSMNIIMVVKILALSSPHQTVIKSFVRHFSACFCVFNTHVQNGTVIVLCASICLRFYLLARE